VCTPFVKVVVSITRSPTAPFDPAVFWQPGNNVSMSDRSWL
jgi:hypothetical protein